MMGTCQCHGPIHGIVGKVGSSGVAEKPNILAELELELSQVLSFNGFACDGLINLRLSAEC